MNGPFFFYCLSKSARGPLAVDAVRAPEPNFFLNLAIVVTAPSSNCRLITCT